jgi:hypothetical protein
LLLALLLLAGCQTFTAKVDDMPVGDNGPNPNGSVECNVDMECELAGAKCCDCPTYAAPLDDPTVRACADVNCPLSSCPANVRAACHGGACVLACLATTCDQSCAFGFQLDATGCLDCACAAAPTSGCNIDSDCVRVAADCCGCAHGGNDTAVLASDAASYEQALMCPAAPTCPDPASCAPDLMARCIAGACQLAPPTPAGACGRPDLPACPPGTMCTINGSDASTQQGVGVCM